MSATGIEINVPIELTEINGEVKTSVNLVRPADEVISEMPTVTSLLQRKKLAVPQKPEVKAQEEIQVSPQIALDVEVPQTAGPIEPVMVSTAKEVPPAPISVAPVSVDVVQIQTDSEPVFTPPKPSSFHESSLTASSAASFKTDGAPPLFTGKLKLSSFDSVKDLTTKLKKFKKSSNLKKLISLEFLSSKFLEIAFLETSSNSSVVGLFGFGNPALVTEIKNKQVDANEMPSFIKAFEKGCPVVFSKTDFTGKESSNLKNIGFTGAFIFVAPIFFKKALLGFWVAATNQKPNWTEKDLKKIGESLNSQNIMKNS